MFIKTNILFGDESLLTLIGHVLKTRKFGDSNGGGGWFGEDGY